MKAALAGWLLRRWYGGVAPGPGLRALAEDDEEVLMLLRAL